MKWRALTTYMFNTEDERRAGLAGLNLFFGALLGANLGTISDLALRDYVALSCMIAGFVASLFTVLTSRRKGMVALYMGTMIFILSLLLFSPTYRPAGAEEDVTRIVVTLIVWLVFAAVMRFSPAVSDGTPAPTERTAVVTDEI